MGLDIYAGTLTRYYAHNWKTVVEQWAEENGYSFQRITADGQKSPNGQEMSPFTIQKAIEDWRDQTLAAISRPRQKPYVPWPEDNEKPYFTNKPDWDAFGAMLLVAACHSYDEPVPPAVPKNWEFMEHPLIKRLSEDEEKIWSLFKGADWWLPLPDGFMFQASLPTGNQAVIATTAALRMELEKLNSLAWQADENTIYNWSRTEGYPVDMETGSDGSLTERNLQANMQYDTWSLAKFSFSIFYQALNFAEENQVPILLDY